MTDLSIGAAKSQAKALRQALEANGNPTSHSQALELIAQQHGASDWNTLHARLTRRNAPPELSLGDRVAGRYLGQPYSGQIISISGASSHRHVEIKLDQPVDTVTFTSFSSWRRQIRGTLDDDGRSHRKTSDGAPQLIVEKISR